MVTIRYIRFTGHLQEIEQDLQDGQRVALQGELEVNSTTTKPLGDGSSQATYKLMPIWTHIKSIDPQYKQVAEMTRVKNKSNSKRFRDLLYILWQQQHQGKYNTFESFYDTYYNTLINNVKQKLQ